MQSSSLFLLLSMGIFSQAAFALSNSTYDAYIDLYSPIAVAEMERTGIPASIKMAQAILESNAGRSELARRANNHFGIKCGGNWNGKSFDKKDDDRRNGRLVKSCFRSYDKAYNSFVDHSKFLQQPRYQGLYKLKSDDYKGWARGLKKAGYATSPSYHNKLINLIEQYKLDRLDHKSYSEFLAVNNKTIDEYLSSTGQRDLVAGATGSGVHTGVKNDVRFVITSSPMTVGALAGDQSISVRKILKYNENLSNESQLVPVGKPVYVQRKRKSFRGKEKWHEVEEGETIMDISLAYGLNYEKLLDRNRIPLNKEPAQGQRIKLKGSKAGEPPILRKENQPKLQLANEQHADPEEIGFVIETPKKTATSTAALKKASSDTSTELPPVQSSDPPVSTSAVSDPFGPAPSTAPAINDEPADTAENATVNTSPNSEFYVVQRGDTLWGIARKHELSIEDLKALNDLKGNTIQNGMRLRLE